MSAYQGQAAVELEPGSNDIAQATSPTKRPAPTRREPKQLPPFKVLLHNDDVNTFEHVIGSILKVVAIQPKEAVLKALEAHESGVSLLLVTHKERAELLVEQFTTFQLVVTMEPDAG